MQGTTQAYKWYDNMNDAMHKGKERESQSIKCKQQDVFRGSSTELYVPAFTEKDFWSTNLST